MQHPDRSIALVVSMILIAVAALMLVNYFDQQQRTRKKAEHALETLEKISLEIREGKHENLEERYTRATAQIESLESIPPDLDARITASLKEIEESIKIQQEARAAATVSVPHSPTAGNTGTTLPQK